MTKNTNWPWPVCRGDECCDTDCTSQESQSLREQLGNLLALIHRDGGHHQTDVGAEQALIDAQKVLLDWRQSHDELAVREKQIVMLREAIGAWDRSEPEELQDAEAGLLKALAATEADLGRYILCEREPVAWENPDLYPQIVDHQRRSTDTPLYRARRSE